MLLVVTLLAIIFAWRRAEDEQRHDERIWLEQLLGRITSGSAGQGSVRFQYFVSSWHLRKRQIACQRPSIQLMLPLAASSEYRAW